MSKCIASYAHNDFLFRRGLYKNFPNSQYLLCSFIAEYFLDVMLMKIVLHISVAHHTVHTPLQHNIFESMFYNFVVTKSMLNGSFLCPNESWWNHRNSSLKASKQKAKFRDLHSTLQLTSSCGYEFYTQTTSKFILCIFKAIRVKELCPCRCQHSLSYLLA